MEREMRYEKDGDGERGRQNKRKGNEKEKEREGSIEGDVWMKGKGEDGREEQEIKDEKGVGAGRETDGWCKTMCVCVILTGPLKQGMGFQDSLSTLPKGLCV